MKNFTNNFKQFTSRLSARWLIMALMLLLGTSSAWAAIYIAGSFNGWAISDGSYELKNNTLTIILGQGSYEYKRVIDGNWESGSNRTFSVGTGGGIVKFSSDGNVEVSSAFNQSAGTFYYDAKNTSGVISNNKTYFIYGGASDASTRVTMNRVAGTKNLFSASISAKNSIVGWYVFSQSSGYTENMNKWCYSGDNTSTHTYKSAFTSNKIYAGNSTSTYETAEGQTKKRYEWSATQPTYSSSLAVTIQNYVGSAQTANAGTVTIKQWNSTTSSEGKDYTTSFLSSASTNNSKTTGYLTALKVTATPNSGYELVSLTVNGTSVSSGHEFEVTAATTIKATWELDCEKPAAPQLSVNKKINVCEGKDNTYGYIKIDNYDSYSNCKFYLGSESNEITNNISEGLIGVNEPSSYKVIVKNDCGSTNEAIIDFTATNILTPTGSVSISDNSPICSGEKATLTANVTTSNTISSYTWTKNDGSAHGGTLSNNGKTLTTASLAANTSYKVSVTLTNSGCSKTFAATNNPYTVTVNSAPSKPTVTLSPDDGNIIAGKSTATLTVSSPGGGVTYTLYERTRGKIDEGKTSFEITEAGTYYVKGANDCGESSASDEKIVKVCAAAPTVTIEGVTAPVATCKTLKAYFKITNIGGEACSMLEKKSGIRFYVTEEDARNDKNKKVGMLVTGIPAVNTEYNLTANYDWILPGTTYYYRAFAENCYGSAMSETIGSITTPASDLVVGTISGTNNVCSGTSTTLTLNGMTNGTVTKWQKSTDNSSFTDIANTTTTLNTGNLSVNTYFRAVVSSSSCRETKNTASYLVNVNPLPTISITGNPSAVFYEDVVLTATATDGATVKWYEDDVEKATGATYVVTSASETSKTVTAKAFLNGCESAEPASHTVNFEAEGECETGRTKIYFRKSYTTKEYYHFNINDGVYLYAWNSYTNAKYTGEYPGTEIEKTEKINGTEYYVYEFTEAQSTENLKIIVRATYDYCSNNYCEIGKTRDIALDVPGATYTLELANGDTNKVKQAETEHKKGDSNTNYDVYLFDVNKNSTGGGITITVPAVKTVSVTSDEDGNVTMVGQVVKTGCDTQAILGLQYKKRKQDGTYDANYTTYPNPGTKEAISAGKTFTVTTKLEDGTYMVRARIDNSHTTNGYGEDISVVVNTTKTPISNVTLNYCDEYGEGIPDPKPMCKGATAYVKLSYVGSKYSDIKWLVEGVETDDVTDEGDGVWSYIIQGTGQLSVELRNDANKDGDNPTWATSDKLSFTMKEEPTPPYISINPASGVLCEGYTATITVTNPSTDCAYKLVEKGSKAGFTDYESGGLTYTVGSVGKYYVAAQHKDCRTNEYTSNQVEINQIIRTSASISIETANPPATTTPWEPVTITVKPDAGYTYELTYTEGDLAAVDGVIIKQNGDSYTYYIPRPDSWGTGDESVEGERTDIEYGIKAKLKVDGEATQCNNMSEANTTITLKDEENEKCN